MVTLLVGISRIGFAQGFGPPEIPERPPGFERRQFPEHTPSLPITEFERKVQAGFAQKTSVEFDATPLTDALAAMEERLGIPVLLDEPALADARIPLDFPITLQLTGVSAQAALDAMRSQSRLTWRLRDPFLVITTPRAAIEMRVMKVYDVSDLVVTEQEGRIAPEFDQLTRLLRTGAGGRWKDGAGNGGTMTPLELPGLDVLVVNQTHPTHWEIGRLLSRLRQLRSEKLADPVSPVEQSIRHVLRKHVSVKFVRTPLNEVVDWLQNHVSDPVWLDVPALKDEGIRPDEPVNFRADGVPLLSVLEQILEGYGLTWVAEFESLVITSQINAEEVLTTRLYDVSDLVSWNGSLQQTRWRVEELGEFIQQTTSGPWELYDGLLGGDMCVYCQRGLAVISIPQTQRVHEEVADLLADIRRLQRRQNDAPAEALR